MSGVSTPPALSGAVIAGGASVRLGTDKRLVTVDGAPLLARTVATLRGLADDVQVVVARAEDRDLVHATVGDDVTVGFDARPDVGPAAGLETALAGARHALVLVVATDHPALSVDVLRLLVTRAAASDAHAVALAGPRGGEPFLAVYRRDALATVRAALDAGTRRMQEVLAALEPDLVGPDEWRTLDPEGRTLADVDVPEDLEPLS